MWSNPCKYVVAYVHLGELHSVWMIPRRWMNSNPAVMSPTRSLSCLAPPHDAGLGQRHRVHPPGALACLGGSLSAPVSGRDVR